ncbi:hypothetical protein PG994_015331 [Apiospora phragmitis]|uniref:Uncharacterized protein n=1 Tax=Apiospora phragmitis TaxID=2905665 RepID=A0ABR1SR80_9PEZI
MGSPFTTAPAEIRRLIYSHLFNHPIETAIKIRNADENQLPRTPMRIRSRYHVIGKASMLQRRGSYETTYYYHDSQKQSLTSSLHQQYCYVPETSKAKDQDNMFCALSSFQDKNSGSTSEYIIYAALMRVSRLVYTETSSLVYGQHTFDFGADMEAVEPFLSDLTAPSRRMIHAISLYKRGPFPYYGLHSDIDLWRSVCRYLSKLSPPSASSSLSSGNRDDENNSSITDGSNETQEQNRLQIPHGCHHGIRKLRLVVECGKPTYYSHLSTADTISDEPREMSAADFQLLIDIKHESLDWVTELAQVGGIEELELLSRIIHCPPPSSTSMILFAALSTSIHKGFAECLRKQWRVVY